MIEYISDKAFTAYARRIERERMRKNGESLTAGSIARAAQGFIVEVRDNGRNLIVRTGWRDAMRLA